MLDDARLVCPACHQENGVGIRFCRKCGNLLTGAAVHASAAPQMFGQWPAASNTQQDVAQAWGCPTCRHENQAHHEFCLGCGGVRREGGVLVERGYAYNANPAASRKRSLALVVLIGITIIVAVIGGVAALILAR